MWDGGDASRNKTWLVSAGDSGLNESWADQIGSGVSG